MYMYMCVYIYIYIIQVYMCNVYMISYINIYIYIYTYMHVFAGVSITYISVQSLFYIVSCIMSGTYRSLFHASSNYVVIK